MKLIQVFLFYGVDLFCCDRKGKFFQNIINDDFVKVIFKRLLVVVVVQCGIQEKVVFGYVVLQGGVVGGVVIDVIVGCEVCEMKGYLKKWINYCKGY